MNCEEAMLLISGHLDGENTKQEEAALQNHLLSCADCRKLLTAFEEADKGMLDLEEEPPETLIPGTMYRIRKESGTEKKRRLPFGVFTGLAAAVVLVLLVQGNVISLPGVKTMNAVAAADTTVAATAAETVPETMAAEERASITAYGIEESIQETTAGAQTEDSATEQAEEEFAKNKEMPTVLPEDLQLLADDYSAPVYVYALTEDQIAELSFLWRSETPQGTVLLLENAAQLPEGTPQETYLPQTEGTSVLVVVRP